jgi:hypothetical protein
MAVGGYEGIQLSWAPYDTTYLIRKMLQRAYFLIW